jgi:hypothetical protein
MLLAPLSSCVNKIPSADAVSVDAETPDGLAPVAAAPVATGTREVPAGTLLATLRWSHTSMLGATVFDADVVVSVRLAEVTADRDISDGDNPEADGESATDEAAGQTSYVVAGVASHGNVACDAPGSISCRPSYLRDASVVGVGSMLDDKLTIRLDWREFGPEGVAAPIETELTVGLDTLRTGDIADGLVGAGIIGRPFTIDLKQVDGALFGTIDGSLRADGVFQVLGLE